MLTEHDACVALFDLRQHQRMEPFRSMLAENVSYLSKWVRFETADELATWLLECSLDVAGREGGPSCEHHVGIFVNQKGAESPCVYATCPATGSIIGIDHLHVEGDRIVRMSHWHCPNYYPPYHRDGDRIWEGEWRKGPLTRAEYDALTDIQKSLVAAFDVPVVEEAPAEGRTH